MKTWEKYQAELDELCKKERARPSPPRHLHRHWGFDNDLAEFEESVIAKHPQREQ